MKNEEVIEELLQALEGASNFCRGLAMFESRIPQDVKEALFCKTEEINEIVKKHLKD